MDHTSSIRLRAILIEIRDLADKAQMCTEHTFYKSTNAESMKKYKRTDQQVAAWLNHLDASIDRLRAHRATIAELGV